MDFQALVNDLRRRLTLQQIADEVGAASRGHVHDLLTGKQREPRWHLGDAIIRLHKRVMRRKT
jgi:hypothetical protein